MSEIQVHDDRPERAAQRHLDETHKQHQVGGWAAYRSIRHGVEATNGEHVMATRDSNDPKFVHAGRDHAPHRIEGHQIHEKPFEGAEDYGWTPGMSPEEFDSIQERKASHGW